MRLSIVILVGLLMGCEKDIQGPVSCAKVASSLQDVCDIHSMKCQPSAYGRPKDGQVKVFIYRNPKDSQSLGLLTVTPKELDVILTALEKNYKEVS